MKAAVNIDIVARFSVLTRIGFSHRLHHRG